MKVRFVARGGEGEVGFDGFCCCKLLFPFFNLGEVPRSNPTLLEGIVFTSVYSLETVCFLIVLLHTSMLITHRIAIIRVV